MGNWAPPAYSLSYANRPRLDLSTPPPPNPWLLLLDEPAAGMNSIEMADVGAGVD